MKRSLERNSEETELWPSLDSCRLQFDAIFISFMAMFYRQVLLAVLAGCWPAHIFPSSLSVCNTEQQTSPIYFFRAFSYCFWLPLYPWCTWLLTPPFIILIKWKKIPPKKKKRIDPSRVCVLITHWQQLGYVWDHYGRLKWCITISHWQPFGHSHGPIITCEPEWCCKTKRRLLQLIL